MSYSISTYTLFHLPIDVAIERLILKGWRSIEMMGEGKNHGRILLDMDQTTLKKIAKLGKDNDVTFGLHLPIDGFNPASSDEETIKIWKKCLSIIDIIDVKYVLMHPGINVSVRDGIESTVLFAKRMLEDLPDQTKLVIENIPNTKNGIGVQIDQLVSIIHKINDERARIMLDTGHCYMNEKEQFLNECEKTFLYLFGLHINDNHGKEDEHLQIGEGTIPFEQLFLHINERDLEYVLETKSVDRAEHSKLQIMKCMSQPKK